MPLDPFVSVRLRPRQRERLERLARVRGKNASETLVGLIEEALRAAEYPLIHFRDTAVGREAYVMGTGTAVWEVVWLAEHFEGDAERVAAHMSWPLFKVQAALNYAAQFPHEVRDALDDMERGPADLRKIVPGLRVFDARNE